jgi:hypothetical protein
MVNEQGGVKGHKIVLVTADATNPAVATNEARRLVTRENVKLLTGTYGSSISLAIAAVANQFNVPYWEGSAVSDELTSRGYKYVFRMNDNASAMSGGLVQAVTDLFAPKIGKPIKDLKIVMIHEDSAFGTSNRQDLRSQIKQKGGSVTLEALSGRATQTCRRRRAFKQREPRPCSSRRSTSRRRSCSGAKRGTTTTIRAISWRSGAGQAKRPIITKRRRQRETGRGVLLVADVPRSRNKPDAQPSGGARRCKGRFFKSARRRRLGKPGSRAGHAMLILTTTFPSFFSPLHFLLFSFPLLSLSTVADAPRCMLTKISKDT